MLQGYPSWNVPLENTLNSLPPSVHDTGLTNKKHLKPEGIKTVKNLKESDFILTGGQDGSINIWNSKIRLHRVCGYNFKSKLY